MRKMEKRQDKEEEEKNEKIFFQAMANEILLGKKKKEE